MGLDGVELIMTTEESFGISITDEEASKIINVDDLYLLVLSKVGLASKDKCLTAKAFYLLRTVIAKRVKINRCLIRKETQLQELILLNNRKSIWKSIGLEMNMILPDLTRNIVLNYALWIIPSLSFIYAINIHNFKSVLVFLLGISTTYGIAKTTEPLKRYFEPKTITMEALTRKVVARNFATLSATGKNWNEIDLYQSLLEIISKQIGIPKSRIQKHHRFVDDLRMD